MPLLCWTPESHSFAGRLSPIATLPGRPDLHALWCLVALQHSNGWQQQTGLARVAIIVPTASPVYLCRGWRRAQQLSHADFRLSPLLQLLPAKVSATSSVSSFAGGDRPVPESPARNLAAMLRSTLRNPGPSGQKLREAFAQGATHNNRPGPPTAAQCRCSRYVLVCLY